MKALHFGAGNIGRGFIGKLLADAGIQLTFADVNQVVLDALNARHSYQVHVVGETEQVDTVSGVNAVSSIGDDVVDLIAQVDLVTTAVGPVVLERIAPAIAKGLVKRKEQGNESPLNIIACENMVRGTMRSTAESTKPTCSSTHALASSGRAFITCPFSFCNQRSAGSDGRNIQRMDC